MYQKPTMPIGMGKIFTNSFKLYKSTFWRSIFFAFIAAIASAQTATRMADDHDFIFNTMSMYTIKWPFVVYSIVVLLIVIWAYGAIFYQINKTMNGQKGHVGHASLHGLVQLPSLLAVTFLYLLVTAIGYVLIIIPGIIISVNCVLALAIVGIGAKNPIAALFESNRIVWPHWWRALVLTLIPMLCFITVGFVGNYVSQEVFIHSQHSLNYLLMIRIVSSIVLGTLYTPWFYSLMMLVLNDLRLRYRVEPHEAVEFEDTYDQEENYLEKHT